MCCIEGAGRFFAPVLFVQKPLSNHPNHPPQPQTTTTTNNKGCLPIAHPDHMKPEKLGSAELVEEVEVRSEG